MTDSLFDDNWLVQLASYHKLWVGFSGGLDSTVLLHALATQPCLKNKLSAIHIHHGLSRHADTWVKHCQRVCDGLSIPLIVERVAFAQRSNIEEQARKARYAAFIALMGSEDGLALAHHADDQAETLLLQILRGAGVDGLAAMPASKPLGQGVLVRPFLHHSRASLETWACSHQLSWIEDESNQEHVFSRNYLRHQVMPLLRQRWPAAVANMARTAAHCQQAKINLQALAELDCTALMSPTLSISSLDQQLDYPRFVNLLRVWLTNNQVRLPSTTTLNRIINEVIFANQDAMPCVEWDDTSIRRYRDTLYLFKNNLEPWIPRLERGIQGAHQRLMWSQFPTPLQWNAHCLSATPMDKGLYVPPGSKIEVRFRQGGELIFLRGQTKALKKLWQQWHVPPWQRDLVPLIYIDDELAAVVGFAISDRFYRTDLAYTYQLSYN